MISYRLATPDDLGTIANEIDASPVVGLDIETSGSVLDPKGHIRLVQLRTAPDSTPWIIDLYQVAGLGPVADALRDSPGVKIVQNARFEQKWFLHRYDVELWPVFDTWRAAVLVNNGHDLGHNLYDLYRRELKTEPEAEDLGGTDWSAHLSPAHYDYAAEDVLHLHQLRDTLKAQLSKNGLNRVALIEFGAVLPEAAVELAGMPLDAEMWNALAVENATRADKFRKELLWELPSPGHQIALPGFMPDFNLNSPMQLLESLHRVGLKDLEDTKEISLAMFAGEYPIIKKILSYREADKQVSTYGPEYPGKNINLFTGRVHPDYFPFTGAGRYACSKPNIQQIPRDTRFRKCFRTPAGRRFVLCVAEGTRVATTHGLVSVENVLPGSKVVLEDGSCAVVKATLDRGVAETVRVRTRLGYELTCTSEHRVRVREASGAYVWREVEALRVTDAVALQSGRGLSSLSSPSLPVPQVVHFNDKPVQTPERMTPALAELLGYLTGDGTFQPYYFGFVVNDQDEDVLGRLCASVKLELGREPPSVLHYRGVFDVRVGSRPLLRWFEQLGAAKDRVPDFLWISTPEIVGAWLRGLFEADGCVSGPSLTFSTVSPRLAQEVQELLLALGIVSRRWLYRHGKPGVGYIWNIRVVSEYEFLEKFRVVVGLLSSRKQAALDALVARLEDSPKSAPSVSIPNVRAGLIRRLFEGEASALMLNCRFRDRLGLKTARRLVQLDSNAAEDLGLLRTLHDGTFFDFVASVEPAGVMRVYDLSVPGPTAYISAGFVSHNCDYSNIEMRIVAEISGDLVLIEIFVRDEDAHYATAALMLGKDRSQVTKAERQQAKPVNFGLIYGMFPKKLVLYAQANYGVSLTLKEATNYRTKFFEAYRGIARWHERVLERAQVEKMARTLGGRLRYLDPETARNEFYNTPVQGTGADGLKAALRAVYMRLKKTFGSVHKGPVQMCHHVHDEIILETSDDKDVIEASKIELEAGMLEGMTPFLKRVPVKAECSVGESWAAK